MSEPNRRRSSADDKSYGLGVFRGIADFCVRHHIFNAVPSQRRRPDPQYQRFSKGSPRTHGEQGRSSTPISPFIGTVEPADSTSDSHVSPHPELRKVDEVEDMPQEDFSSGDADVPQDIPPNSDPPLDCPFDGEDPEDYTLGHARMIQVQDGGKPCAALLMTLSLSQDIQDTLVCSREIRKIEAEFADRDELDQEDIIRLQSIIHEAEAEIEALREGKETNGEIEEKIHAYEAMVGKAQQEKEMVMRENEALKDDLGRSNEDQRNLQGRVNRALESVFMDYYLVEAEQEEKNPVEANEVDVPVAFEDDLETLNNTPQDDPPSAPKSDDHLEVEKEDDRERVKKDFLTLHAKAHRRLLLARHALTTKPDDDYAAHLAREDDLQHNREVPSQEDFDLTLLLDGRRATRAVIEAEEFLDEVEKAAEEAGIDLEGDGEGDDYEGFGFDGGSGYGDDWEGLAVESTDAARILRWREKVTSVNVELPPTPTHNTTPSPVLRTTWSATSANPHDNWDSVSMLDWDWEQRRRIRKWTVRQERARAGLEN
ncbi:hypothetical protein K402DRAFT_422449 [Aulographum hederae CBS 113979]|uniref:Uncharacterized protein n=1 Tax=Aulographum hederae CBS 113979 TaxID=1176131 RepID=A0A6G1GVP4_9PEZI|nr:hypothetical protein K402DRAFT_422449 [Aulographum hederae CBS 113979]